MDLEARAQSIRETYGSVHELPGWHIGFLLTAAFILTQWHYPLLHPAPYFYGLAVLVLLLFLGKQGNSQWVPSPFLQQAFCFFNPLAVFWLDGASFPGEVFTCWAASLMLLIFGNLWIQQNSDLEILYCACLDELVENYHGPSLSSCCWLNGRNTYQQRTASSPIEPERKSLRPGSQWNRRPSLGGSINGSPSTVGEFFASPVKLKKTGFWNPDMGANKNNQRLYGSIDRGAETSACRSGIARHQQDESSGVTPESQRSRHSAGRMSRPRTPSIAQTHRNPPSTTPWRSPPAWNTCARLQSPTPPKNGSPSSTSLTLNHAHRNGESLFTRLQLAERSIPTAPSTQSSARGLASQMSTPSSDVFSKSQAARSVQTSPAIRRRVLLPRRSLSPSSRPKLASKPYGGSVDAMLTTRVGQKAAQIQMLLSPVNPNIPTDRIMGSSIPSESSPVPQREIKKKRRRTRADFEEQE